jgi:hypothetical protein
MPREAFRHPEDAAEQLARAVALHERLFGARPAGLWPSEGSVSDAMVPLVVEAGFEWMATDEEILARTTGRGFTRDDHGHVDQPERLYRAYRVGASGRTVACAFRDHTLSDLIGFAYGSWGAAAAADDFVRRLAEAGARYTARTGGEEATIVVILDGENAWEHYEGQGRPFLRALYGRLASHPHLRTVTMSEACGGATEPLPSIFPGSWINGDFYIWIGHRDDHQAWSQLVDARRALESPPPGLPDEALARAREEMLIAEGSDWFWWYGDDHSSEHDVQFDELFRRHVRNIYRALDKPIPEDLFVTNITTQPPVALVHPPTGFIRPAIDGEITSYFEWIGAGCVEAAAAGGAMHQVSDRPAGITLIEFGFDLSTLYLRVDGTRPMGELLQGGLALTIRFLKPSGARLVLGQDGRTVGVRLQRRGRSTDWRNADCPGLEAAAGRVAEIRVPFAGLGVQTGDRVAFFVLLTRGGTELEQHPRHQPIELDVPDAEFAARNWTA